MCVQEMVYHVCTFCKLQRETFSHLYWECEKIQPILTFVSNLILPNHQELVTKTNVLVPSNTPHYVTLLFTLFKYYVHVNRVYNRKLALPHFKNKLKFHLVALHTTYNINSSESKFFKRFGTLYNKSENW